VYDVIIVGASFAGLAVANQLRDYRVLLIDHKPVGVGQTSACGTILQVLRYWQLMDSLFQTHDRFILHTPRRELQVRSPYLWCTFDYQQLCRTLFARSGAEFVQARAQGYDGDTVQTSKGSFAGRYVVDASGSRAVLASSIIPGYANDHQMNLGIEMICALPPDHPLQRDGLHFWYGRGLLRGGWAWAFPRGDHVNVGLGAFGGVGHLRAPLLRLVERLQLEPTTIHGAHLPFRLRAPYVDKLFVVGDAAGQCLGLSGEGIRSSMYFGEFCGRVLRRVLAGRSSLREGLEAYEGIVLARQRFSEPLPALRLFSCAHPIEYSNGSRWPSRTIAGENASFTGTGGLPTRGTPCQPQAPRQSHWRPAQRQHKATPWPTRRPNRSASESNTRIQPGAPRIPILHMECLTLPRDMVY
jgi:flavin-dependent dehydrogenase